MVLPQHENFCPSVIFKEKLYNVTEIKLVENVECSLVGAARRSVALCLSL